MAIYFKCPHRGNPFMDWQGENLIDYTNGIYQCPACKKEFTLDDNNTMEYEEFIKEENLKK